MRSIRTVGTSIRGALAVGVVAIALAAVALVVNAGWAGAQPATRTLGPDAGVVINPVRADMTAQYEMVMERVREALSTSEDPVRRQQAAGWRVYRATEPGPNGAVLYIWVVNPAVQDADYTISNILGEAFPAEVYELYETYSDAHAGGQTFINLTLRTDFSR